MRHREGLAVAAWKRGVAGGGVGAGIPPFPARAGLPTLTLNNYAKMNAFSGAGGAGADGAVKPGGGAKANPAAAYVQGVAMI